MLDASAMQPLTPDRLYRPDLSAAPEVAAIFEYAPRSGPRAAVRFSIWLVTTIDEAIALVTRDAAGERAGDGVLPDGNHSRGVEERLKRTAIARKEVGKGHAGGDST